MKIRVMRPGKEALLLLLLLAFLPSARGQSFFPTDLELDSFQQSYENVEIGDLDISGILKEVSRSNPGLSEDDTSLLIRRNVSYIIFHKLNRDRLFIAPDGQYIVDKAAEIYGSLNQIEELISKGHEIDPVEGQESGNIKIFNELKRTARSLRKNFRQYFVELRETDYEFQVRLKNDRKQMMSDYLAECRKVNDQLKLSLDKFFFSSTPGVVTVEDYSSYSVALLSQSLEALSDSFAKRLRN